MRNIENIETEKVVIDSDFNELAGRVEGVSRAFMLLVAMMEEKDMVNGRSYCASLRRTENALCFPAPSLAATKRTLREMAEELDSARTARRSKVSKQGNQKG